MQPGSHEAGEAAALEDAEEGGASQASAETVAGNAGGGMRGGHDPRELAAKRWEGAAAQRAEDPVSDLRLILDVQRRIATGRVKGATAAQQTQAARAYAELLPLLRAAERERAADSFSLAQLTDRLDVLRYVVQATPGQLDEVRALAAASAGEGEEERAL